MTLIINPKVVDISHYDDVQTIGTSWVGFEKLYAAGYRGVINKSTQGRGMVDVSYQRRRQHALDAGLLYGAYHYLDGSPVADQVNHFLEVVKPDANTLLAIDHETRGVPISAAQDFAVRVKAAIGRYPVLYSGFLVKEQISTTKVDPFWSQIKLWLSHYSSAPKWPPTWKAPWLWQFTGDGVGPGPHQAPGVTIAGGCDINSYAGTDDQLKAEWAS